MERKRLEAGPVVLERLQALATRLYAFLSIDQAQRHAQTAMGGRERTRENNCRIATHKPADTYTHISGLWVKWGASYISAHPPAAVFELPHQAPRVFFLFSLVSGANPHFPWCERTSHCRRKQEQRSLFSKGQRQQHRLRVRT